MEKKILCVFVIILFLTVSVGSIASPAKTIHGCLVERTSRKAPVFDPAWIIATIFGSIENPQVSENEYGNLYLSFRAVRVFVIGHYTGFGTGPVFMIKRDVNLTLQYESFPGFRGWYWDNFILGRYQGL